MEIIHQYTNNITTKEEWLAFQIWLNLFDYYADNVDNDAAHVPYEFIDSLHYEIINKKDVSDKHRNVLICVSDSLEIDLPLLYIHMERNEILKVFSDKRTTKERGFLTIWIE